MLALRDVGRDLHAHQPAVRPAYGAIPQVVPALVELILKFPGTDAGGAAIGVQQLVIGAEGAGGVQPLQHLVTELALDRAKGLPGGLIQEQNFMGVHVRHIDRGLHGVEDGHQAPVTFLQDLLEVFAVGDVLVGARHAQGPTGLIPADNARPIEYPAITAVPGAHAVLGLVDGGTAGQVSVDRLPGALPVLGMDEFKPAFDQGVIDLLGGEAQHLGPVVVAAHLAGDEVPVPGSQTATRQDELQALFALAQQGVDHLEFSGALRHPLFEDGIEVLQLMFDGAQALRGPLAFGHPRGRRQGVIRRR